MPNPARLWYPTLEPPMKPLAVRPLLVLLCLGCERRGMIAASHRAAAAASVTIGSGWNSTRTTIPVTIVRARELRARHRNVGDYRFAVAGRLGRGFTAGPEPSRLRPTDAPTSTVRPRSRTLASAGDSLHDVPALISSNLTGYGRALRLRLLRAFSDAHRSRPPPSHALPQPLRVSRAYTACRLISRPAFRSPPFKINDTWLSHIVLDSGMAGGGALWDGVRGELHRPLVANADYETMPSAVRDGFACGALASIRYAPSSAESACRSAPSPNVPTATTGSSRRILRAFMRCSSTIRTTTSASTSAVMPRSRCPTRRHPRPPGSAVTRGRGLTRCGRRNSFRAFARSAIRRIPAQAQHLFVRPVRLPR